MFNSVILDVAIGLMFAFLVVSLVASAATEALASMLKWRSGTLLDGVKALLNDPHGTGLAKELYNHALVNPRADGNAAGADTASARPTYIEPACFASALIEILDRTGKPGDRQIQLLLDGMVKRAGGDLSALRAELAGWFDRSMDRVSGAYKRRAQLVSFMLAFAVAVALDVDALRIASHVWERQALTVRLQPNLPSAEAAVQQLATLGLPIGWFDSQGRPARAHAWTGDTGAGRVGALLIALAGWLITALASLFGAPFWFDGLQRVVSLRGAGPKPRERPAEPASGPGSATATARPLAAAARG